jgi:hypothetical protein
MARPLDQLQTLLENIEGVSAAYLQAPGAMEYPCIKYERDRSRVIDADNLKFVLFKRYQVVVIDRSPDSAIPDRVEALPFCTLDRFYVVNGLNHWSYTLYF